MSDAAPSPVPAEAQETLAVAAAVNDSLEQNEPQLGQTDQQDQQEAPRSQDPPDAQELAEQVSKVAEEDAAKDLQNDLFGDDDDDDEEEEEQIRARVRAGASRGGEGDDAGSRAVGRGGGDDEDDDDDDDEDAGVVRQSRRARQRLGTDSASPEPGATAATTTASTSQAARGRAASPMRSSSPAAARRTSRSASPRTSPFRRSAELEDDDDEELRRQLEYKEEDDVQPDENIELAQLALPQMPVRRTKEHWMVRIPHFLRYATQPFDADTWDDEVEEEMLRDEGFTTGFSHDAGAVSLLRTSNTIRWRYSDQVDDDGARIPESNARIVRWSDGTMSLQVGRELFDITQQTEAGRVQAGSTAGPRGAGNAAPSQSQSQSQSQMGPGPSSQGMMPPSQSQADLRSMPMGGAGSSSRPAQSLSYLVVPHAKAAVMEAEGPIAGSLAFTPADTRSETHMRIAKALRFQKTARVVATAAGEGARDPELEKARIEKELKDAEKRRIRERQRADRKSGKFDDDMFDIESRRRGGRSAATSGGRKSGAGPRGGADYWSDESEAMSVDGDLGEERAGPGRGQRQTRGDAKRAAAGRYADDDDGFIVDDEGDDDDEAGGGGYSKKKKRTDYESDGMDIDDEPDAMEIAEARIEEQERARKKAAAGTDASSKGKKAKSSRSWSDDDDDDDDGEDGGRRGAAGARGAGRDAEGEAEADAATAAAASASASEGAENGNASGAAGIKKKRIIESDDDE
ncbi:related to LEO1 - component of the Paf1 complex [Pseudozyma flocculosa]|uniref:Related to LEO1 - component of the Paf1 complex n=1 Tax=Pseudozyma flocculosa TaxID=84751 RepID=A0A5C3FCT6_9BASI|nr:related to LEO1 - component of the Paf1 complex [Pseudozyma flocculosa]